MLISNYCVNYYKDGFIYKFYVLADNSKAAAKAFREADEKSTIYSVMACNRYRLTK